MDFDAIMRQQRLEDQKRYGQDLLRQSEEQRNRRSNYDANPDMRRGAYLPRDYGITQLSSTGQLDPLLKASERQNAQLYRDELLRQMQEQKVNKEKDRMGVVDNPYGNSFLPAPNRNRSQSFGNPLTSGTIAPVGQFGPTSNYISPVMLMAKDPPSNLNYSSNGAYGEELKRQMEANRMAKELEKKRDRQQEEIERRKIEADIQKWKAEEEAEAQRQRDKREAQQRRTEALARATEMSQSFTAVKPHQIGAGLKTNSNSDGLEWWERKQNKTKLPSSVISSTTSTFLPTNTFNSGGRISPYGRLNDDYSSQPRLPRSFSTSPVAGQRQPLDKASRQSSAMRRNEETLRQMSARRERLQKEQQRVTSALGRKDYGDDVFNSDEEDNFGGGKPLGHTDLSGIITPPPAQAERKISPEFHSYPTSNQHIPAADDEDSPLVKLIKNSRTRLESPTPAAIPHRNSDINRSFTDDHITTN